MVVGSAVCLCECFVVPPLLLVCFGSGSDPCSAPLAKPHPACSPSPPPAVAMLALRTAAVRHVVKRAPVVAAAAAAAAPYSVLARAAAQTSGSQRSAAVAVAALPRSSSALSFPVATGVRHFSIETTKVPSLGDSISEPAPLILIGHARSLCWCWDTH